jgi:hypothetical protein
VLGIAPVAIAVPKCLDRDERRCDLAIKASILTSALGGKLVRERPSSACAFFTSEWLEELNDPEFAVHSLDFDSVRLFSNQLFIEASGARSQKLLGPEEKIQCNLPLETTIK